MSYAWCHEDISPTYPQESGIVVSTLRAVATTGHSDSLDTAKEGRVTTQVVSLADLSPQRPGFVPTSVNEGFVVCKVALERIFF